MIRLFTKLGIGTLTVIAVLALSRQISFGQQLLDPLVVYEPATENHFLPGARAAGMGGAQIAAGEDGSALWYNPALLTRIRNAELSGTITHQRFGNNTSLRGYAIPGAKVNNTGLGSLWAMYPVPAERGGLTLGISVNRIRSFDRIFRYASSPDWLANPYNIGWGGGEDENGSLWAWSFGGAIEISPRSSVGISLDILDGHDDYSYFFDSTYTGGSYHFNHDINDNYTGISGKLGASYSAANWLNLGAVIGLPASISIDQTSDTFERGAGRSSEDHGASSYRYTLPFSFGFGAELMYRDILLTGDINYLDYTQLRYKSGVSDLPQANLTVMHYYNETVDYHVGAEYLIGPAGVSLRAGYYSAPIPFNGYPVKTDPHYFTFGAGFLIDRTVNLDLAFLAGSWQRRDLSAGTAEKYDARRFIMTLSYRIR